MFNNSMAREITGNSKESRTKRFDRPRLTMYVIILLRSARDAGICIIYRGRERSGRVQRCMKTYPLKQPLWLSHLRAHGTQASSQSRLSFRADNQRSPVCLLLFHFSAKKKFLSCARPARSIKVNVTCKLKLTSQLRVRRAGN